MRRYAFTPESFEPLFHNKNLRAKSSLHWSARCEQYAAADFRLCVEGVTPVKTTETWPAKPATTSTTSTVLRRLNSSDEPAPSDAAAGLAQCSFCHETFSITCHNGPAAVEDDLAHFLCHAPLAVEGSCNELGECKVLPGQTPKQAKQTHTAKLYEVPPKPES